MEAGLTGPEISLPLIGSGVQVVGTTAPALQGSTGSRTHSRPAFHHRWDLPKAKAMKHRVLSPGTDGGKCQRRKGKLRRQSLWRNAGSVVGSLRSSHHRGERGREGAVPACPVPASFHAVCPFCQSHWALTRAAQRPVKETGRADALRSDPS